MNILPIIMKSNLISNGCKLYYSYLLKLNKASIINNWKIINGTYKNYNFVIAKDATVAKALNIGLTSIHNYKKTLKSLGLITTFKKFTTKTNICKNNHFCQLTVLSKNLPKKILCKLLCFSQNIKKAIILKTCTNIVPQVKKKLNTTITNIHSNVKKLFKKINSISLNNSDVQIIVNTLNTYDINFKNYQIPKYIELYKKSKEKFIRTCKYCSDKYMYSPLHYFTKVFESSNTYKNSFNNFPQREYSDAYLENLMNLLIEN